MSEIISTIEIVEVEAPETTCIVIKDDDNQPTTEIASENALENASDQPNLEIDLTCDQVVEQEKFSEKACEEVLKTAKNEEEILLNSEINHDEKPKENGETAEIIDLEKQEVTEIPTKTPCISISFKNGEVFKAYKEKFAKFLQTLTDFTVTRNNNELQLELVKKDNLGVDMNDWVVIEDDDNSKKRKRNKKGRDSRDRDKDKKEDKEKLFILDTEPSIASARFTGSPMYKSKYKVIEDADFVLEPEVKEDSCPKMICFNCSGNHALKDCQVPKDYQRIKMARNKNCYKAARYHQEDENRFAHLLPGVMSETLKNALGIRKHEIPPHVYKMRVMGYPPGWLEEAKIFHSNLALFDSEGNKDATSSVDVNKFTIDPEKIIDYPGFNCKPGRGTHDKCEYYGVPPYSTALSKENMIEFVNKVIGNESTTLPENEVKKEESRAKSKSPTLIDLEAQKRQLLEALTSNDDSTTQSDLNQSIPISIDTDTDAETDKSACQTPVKEKESPAESPALINSSLMGTPILKALSPYSCLPNLDKFQKDVSPVINFENLPNSTGKYEQMTNVLEKVRTTLKSRFQSSG